ncbi:TIGR00296 family protein [Methanocrinis sp.]|uniref:TIGR00296 family protein n=1 Tax=Methanocrinis sp. TaxID=3101522 RepID=UPI003D09F5EB
MLTIDEGRRAVTLAREALAAYVERKERITPKGLPPAFSEKAGVFVTLHEDGELRGCIGYPEPVMELGRAIVDSAINAGVNDPRFSRVRPEELSQIEIEVTVLTPPRPYDVRNRDLPDAVKVGKHGLIVKRGMWSGLLLPQVAMEWEFDPEDFLCQTCLKAGLPPDSWIDEETEVLFFEGQVFAEVLPGGEVVEKEMDECE